MALYLDLLLILTRAPHNKWWQNRSFGGKQFWWQLFQR